MKYLKLIRIQNLLFLILLIWTFRFFILVPWLKVSGIDVSGNYFHVILLTIATVLIAAGGYVINDYYDVRIDKINRPEKLMVTKFITKPKTLLTHQILTSLGIISGLTLSHIYKSYSLTAVFILTPALLWYYSAYLKRKLIIGNVIISLLAALSVLIITITEMDVLKKSPENLLLTDFYRSTIWVWTIGFSVFSLILTFAREIIKDMEDMTGDAAFDCFSIPIVYGLKKTKIIVSSLLIITQILLLVAGLFLIDIQSLASLIFIILFLILPLIFLTVYLNRASEIQQFKFVAGLLKIIMLSGVLYAVVFSFCLADEKVFSLFGLLFN